MNEILNEKTIVSSSNYNISVPRATAVARISILRSKYVKHTYGLKTFVLGKKEIGFVKKTLNEPIHGYETAWKYMIAYLVNLSKQRKIQIPYDENLPMPDYTKL